MGRAAAAGCSGPRRGSQPPDRRRRRRRRRRRPSPVPRHPRDRRCAAGRVGPGNAASTARSSTQPTTPSRGQHRFDPAPSALGLVISPAVGSGPEEAPCCRRRPLQGPASPAPAPSVPSDPVPSDEARAAVWSEGRREGGDHPAARRRRPGCGAAGPVAPPPPPVSFPSLSCIPSPGCRGASFLSPVDAKPAATHFPGCRVAGSARRRGRAGCPSATGLDAPRVALGLLVGGGRNGCPGFRPRGAHPPPTGSASGWWPARRIFDPGGPMDRGQEGAHCECVLGLGMILIKY